VERLLLKGMNSSNCGQCRVQGCNFPTEAWHRRKNKEFCPLRHWPIIRIWGRDEISVSKMRWTQTRQRQGWRSEDSIRRGTCSDYFCSHYYWLHSFARIKVLWKLQGLLIWQSHTWRHTLISAWTNCERRSILDGPLIFDQ
jgi:hypothetical protein